MNIGDRFRNTTGFYQEWGQPVGFEGVIKAYLPTGILVEFFSVPHKQIVTFAFTRQAFELVNERLPGSFQELFL
jgi:hypothetical protein